MNRRIFTGIRMSAIIMFISFSLVFILFASITSAEVIDLKVDPQVVEPGEVITITGKATEPYEEVWISSSFEIPLDVSPNGKYSREFNNIHFIGGKTDFSLRAENVKNIGLRLSFEQGDYNLEPITATKGIATISVSVPFSKEIEGVIWELPALPPEMDIEVYGDAADDASSVNLKVAITLKSLISYTPLPEYPPLADSSGNFSIRVNTDGIPRGEFVITAGSAEGIEKIEKMVYIGVTPTPSPSPSPSPTPTPSSNADINLFDTGKGRYPSISGTHNGTITPNQTITVSKLYTYPCPGTGGHIEYIKIWNNSGWNVTANWNGYVGDWHNISFSESFTLERNEAYNYTIRTGSYPQIIHNQTLTNEYGTITCTEFTDANGRTYDNWIPAIRLFL